MPNGHILVADDDAAIRTVLNQALSRAGYEVRSTSNAATLWRWVAQGEGDLVITDVVMPDENAFDLLPRMKRVRPGAADHRHERTEHFHDGDPRLRARRLRVPAEAVRPQGADRDRRPRAVAAPRRPARQRRRRERGDPARRPLAGDAGDLPGARPADADRPHGHDHGRDRHRQGARGARAARYGKRRARARSSPSTWRRSRASCSNRSSSATRRAPSPARPPAAPDASSRRRAARSSSTRSATCRWRRRRGSCACSSRASTRRSAAAADQDRRAHRRRDQPGPAHLDPAGPVPRGPVLPPQRGAAAAAAAAGAGRGHPRPRPPLLRAGREGGPAAQAARRRGDGAAQALPLAGQRPRAREPRAPPGGALSAGHDHRRRSSRRSSITPPMAPPALAGRGGAGRRRQASRPRSSATSPSISPGFATRCRRPGSISASCGRSRRR